MPPEFAFDIFSPNTCGFRRITHVDCPLQQIVLRWIDEDDSSPSKVSGGGSAAIDARPIKIDEPSAE
jgi:hypothetical protein